MSDSIRQIEILLEAYYDGLYRCDLDGLSRVFHPNAHYATVRDGAFIHLDMASYAAVLRERTPPASDGDAYEFAIKSIVAEGDAAMAVFHCSMMRRRYVDFLSLIRDGGEWRIISKVFHSEPQT